MVIVNLLVLMEKVYLYGQILMNMMVNGKIIVKMGKEYTYNQMETNIMVIGKMI